MPLETIKPQSATKAVSHAAWRHLCDLNMFHHTKAPQTGTIMLQCCSEHSHTFRRSVKWCVKLMINVALVRQRWPCRWYWSRAAKAWCLNINTQLSDPCTVQSLTELANTWAIHCCRLELCGPLTCPHEHNIKINPHWSFYSLLSSLSGLTPPLLASFSSSVAWSPWCSSFNGSKQNQTPRLYETSQESDEARDRFLPVRWSPFASAGSASLYRSSWGWKQTTASASALTRSYLCMCVHVGIMMGRESRRDGKPYSQTSLLCSVCALILHALLKVLNYAEEKAD